MLTLVAVTLLLQCFELQRRVVMDLAVRGREDIACLTLALCPQQKPPNWAIELSPEYGPRGCV